MFQSGARNHGLGPTVRPRTNHCTQRGLLAFPIPQRSTSFIFLASVAELSETREQLIATRSGMPRRSNVVDRLCLFLQSRTAN